MPIIWYNKAYAYYNLGKYNEAITFAIKATDLARNYVSVWGLQLTCYLTIGDNKKADFVATKMKEINRFNTFEKTNVYRYGPLGTIFSSRF
jgi:tetratricopeptide (TPR) repeat protein